VPLLVEQQHTAEMVRHLELDAEMVVWWASKVECASALARLEHDGTMSSATANTALARLAGLLRAAHEVQPTERVRTTALRLLRSHRLRAADALQLAAAMEASAGAPGSLTVLCLDDRLTQAALREGIEVITDSGTG
jgi:uncharacterized protein